MSRDILNFEEKVKGLQEYYRAIDEIDPSSADHSDIANPDFFYYADGFHASKPLREVREGALFDLACHGLVEYGRRGLAERDIREDTDETRLERADVLSVLTAPATPELREQRAEHIAGLLAGIVSGQSLELRVYDGFHRRYRETEVLDIDLNRALFGVFRNGHVSTRTLTMQYDSPTTFARTDDTQVGEAVVSLDVPTLFREKPTTLEPVAA